MLFLVLLALVFLVIFNSARRSRALRTRGSKKTKATTPGVYNAVLKDFPIMELVTGTGKTVVLKSPQSPDIRLELWLDRARMRCTKQEFASSPAIWTCITPFLVSIQNFGYFGTRAKINMKEQFVVGTDRSYEPMEGSGTVEGHDIHIVLNTGGAPIAGGLADLNIQLVAHK